MNAAALVFNAKMEASLPLADDVAAWLQAQGIQTQLFAAEESAAIEQAVAAVDLVVVLGGDGTTLAAARLAAPAGTPIFGINLGRVGFLSEAEPADWPGKLSQVLEGQYWLEKRLMLKACAERDGQTLGELVALNDIVVSRGVQMRVVRFHLFVDGDHVTTYNADGLIAATPTGSTAYSMAAGGPLLPPQLQNYLVLPVAPHLSFERPLVLHKEAVIKVKVETEHEAMATADGQNAITLANGDEVIISKHPFASHFARVGGPGYFYHRLMQRLNYWSLKN